MARELTLEEHVKLEYRRYAKRWEESSGNHKEYFHGYLDALYDIKELYFDNDESGIDEIEKLLSIGQPQQAEHE